MMQAYSHVTKEVTRMTGMIQLGVDERRIGYQGSLRDLDDQADELLLVTSALWEVFSKELKLTDQELTDEITKLREKF